MARIKIHIPSSLPFETEIGVRITDANYAGHLGNDSVFTLAHEARERFLHSLGFSESDVDGIGIVMNDAAVMYRSEAFPGERLRVEVGVSDIYRKGCDILYRFSCIADGREVARVKTGIVFFDFETRTMVSTPEAFLEAVGAQQH
ncbi:thioesterase family protein [bacterium]|nr:thioesterase family protein [bacterium]